MASTLKAAAFLKILRLSLLLPCPGNAATERTGSERALYRESKLLVFCQTPFVLLWVLLNHAYAGKPENVLFISVDDLRPALGAYGDPLAITPNIDRLAEEGVLFQRHYVQQAVCNPSRASIFTGLRPDELEVVDLKTHFRDTRPDVATLPELFKNNGYACIGIGKIYHWGSLLFDPPSWTEEMPYGRYVHRNEKYLAAENDTEGKADSTEMLEVADHGYWDGRYANAAVDFLERRAQNRPFFLAIGFHKPHLPFTAPKKYWDLYDREDFREVDHPERPRGVPSIAFHQWQELRGYRDIPEEGPLSSGKIAELRHGYYACVSYIDAQVGKLLKALEANDARENTIIALWGDHGFHLGEQDLWAKSTNFELDARAPLIICAPGMQGNGSPANAIVESLDVYPTLADLFELDPEHSLSGVSLRPLLENPERVWNRPAFNQFPRPYGVIGRRKPTTHMGYSVRTDQWRYTVWYNVEKEAFEYPELYSMQESFLETENLAGDPGYGEVERRHQKMIKKLLQETASGN